jgi:drug/metabolite transporter (DMT)-like permease
MPYMFLILTLAGTVAGQLMLRKGLLQVGRIGTGPSEMVAFFGKAFTNFYVLLALALVVGASLAWIAAVSRAQLSHVYPVMGITYVLVPALSVLFFREHLGYLGWLGTILVFGGVFLVLRSQQ